MAAARPIGCSTYGSSLKQLVNGTLQPQPSEIPYILIQYMLTIREQQMTALGLERDAAWCMERLISLYPPFAAASAAERDKWVYEGLERARKYKVDRAEYLQFLCFEQTFFPGCLDDPKYQWALSIVTESGKSSSVRMKGLRRETIRRLLELEAQQEAEKALREFELETRPEPTT